MASLTERLIKAVGADRAYAGVSISTSYEPPGGDKVFPPSFPGPSKGDVPTYLFEERRMDGTDRLVVVLDQVPSQANRVEAAMLRARDEQRIELPLFELRMQASDGVPLRLTSLDLPHRAGDAYLRDSIFEGTAFDDSDLGKRLRRATTADVSAIYELSPESLLFGFWDSHRKGRGLKVARSYSSSVVGVDPSTGERRAGRFDPLNLTGDVNLARADWDFKAPGERKAKGDRLSKVGHGHIPPNPTHGGVTISRAHRHGWLSLAALDNLRFASVSAEAAQLAKATLAALALAGDRLAFAGPSLWLRSGCDLVRTDQQITFASPEGDESVEVSAGQALETFAELRERTARAGLVMSTDTYVVEPKPNLASAIDFSLTHAEAEQAG